jgi:hypothetical protein
MNHGGKKALEQRMSPGFTRWSDGQNRVFFSLHLKPSSTTLPGWDPYEQSPSLVPTGAQTAYLQTLQSGPSANETTRRIAAQLQTNLTSTNYPTTMRILRESEGQFTAPSRKYNWSTRLDYNRDQRDYFTGRFTLALEDNDMLPVDNVVAPSNGIIEAADDYTVVGAWSHIFNDHIVNQLRVQFADNDYRQISRAPSSANLVIAGLINYGRLTTVPLIIKQKRYQFEDLLTWSHGSKDFKFGASYRPVDAHIVTEIGLGGVFQFAAGQPLTRALSASDAGVLVGPLAPPADTMLTALQGFNFGLPSIWQQGFGNPGFPAWQHNLGTFGQVSWKAAPSLTLNLGVRLNYDGEPEPLDRNVSISPRLGFAWDPFGKGETVIRGGFGTFMRRLNFKSYSQRRYKATAESSLTFNRVRYRMAHSRPRHCGLTAST